MIVEPGPHTCRDRFGATGLNPFEALGNVPQSSVSDDLADDLLVRRHADHNETAVAVQESAQRPRGAGQLASALF
jgi:hypothetical protein